MKKLVMMLMVLVAMGSTTEVSAQSFLKKLGIPSLYSPPACKDNGILDEPIMNTASASSSPKALATSDMGGCFPFFAVYSSMNRLISFAVCFIDRDTFTEPSSLMKRLISPAIIGTA